MVEIRLANNNDCAPMLDIYAPVIEHTITSFEYEVPSLLQFRHRVQKTLETFPWLVCSWDNTLAGYAYAMSHRSRQAYQWSVELSVYVHPKYYRRGIAKALYSALMSILKLQGFYTALAGISLPNDVSVEFHKALGFTQVGIYHNVGYKFGGWHATGWWERPLQDHIQEVLAPASIHDVVHFPQFQEILDSACSKLENDKL